MQTMKNMYTWAAVGLVAYLVYRQYQKKQAEPQNIVEIPEAPVGRTSM